MEQGIIEQFVNAIKQEPDDKKTTYSAIVSRIDEEGVIWVYVAGADKDTPTAQTGVEVKKGDNVTVEWRNNKLYIAGNYSNPAAGMDRVVNVEMAAQAANQAAQNAVADAGRAKEAAESVEGIAKSAKTAADTAFTNLSQVQSVLEVAHWIATHGTYVKATVFNPNATYYTLTATQVASPSDDDKDSEGVLIYYELDNGIYVRTTDTSVQSGKTYYNVTGTPVAQPSAEHIADYYTLNVTDAMADYIKSHLALTDDGLYVMKDGSKWKVLVKDDGVDIIDGTGTTDVVVASYGTDILLGILTGKNTLITNNGIFIRNGILPIAFFGDNEVRLGDNSATSIIKLCNSRVKMTATEEGDFSLFQYWEEAGEYGSEFWLSSDSAGVYLAGTAGVNEFRIHADFIELYSDDNTLFSVDATNGFFCCPLIVRGVRGQGISVQENVSQAGEDYRNVISLMTGTGGDNHGVFSDRMGQWLIYSDGQSPSEIAGVKVLKDNGGYIDLTEVHFVVNNIDAGYVSVGSVPANGYKNVSVSFDRNFSSAPYVTASLYTTSTSQIYSNIQVVVGNVTRTGATLRVINGGGSAVSPGLYWQAILRGYSV